MMYRMISALCLIAATPALTATGDPLPTSALRIRVFNDNFRDPAKVQDDFFQGLGPYAGAPYTQMHIGTGERQIAVNGNFLGLGINPFAFKKGGMIARTGTLSPSQKAKVLAAVNKAAASDASKPHPTLTNYLPMMRNVQYFGWALTTKKSYKIPLYVEYAASLPFGGGQWPMLYLYDWKMAPFRSLEIDAMEAPEKSGGNCYYATVHEANIPPSPKRVCANSPLTQPHRYGVLLTAGAIIYYIDRIEVARAPSHVYYQTNYNFNIVIANAIGGKWPEAILGNAASDGSGETRITDLSAYALQ